MLNGIVDNEIASVDGFKHSKAFPAEKAEGLVWTVGVLDSYFTKPKKFIPGTKMSYAGLSGSGSWYLALDRTQWRIGSHEVNFLVPAAVTRRFRVPLLWTLIPGRGNSGTRQRIALMRRYIKLFGVSSIRLLLADREFVGHAWADFLCENNIPSAIR